MTFQKHAEISYHFISDEIVFIDLIYIPVKHQGKGLGKKAIEHFVSILHEDVEEVRIVAATNLTGRVNVFWEKLGFNYLYNIQEEYADVEEDVLHAMTLPVNGAKQKKLIYRHSLNDDEW